MVPQLRLIRGYRALGGPQFQHQGHQVLLGAVMQVPFDASPGPVGGREDPGSRDGQFGMAVLQRVGHPVEAVLQRSDLAPAGFRHARRQVAVAESDGHGGCSPHRIHDRSDDVASEADDEER